MSRKDLRTAAAYVPFTYSTKLAGRARLDGMVIVAALTLIVLSVCSAQWAWSAL